MKVFLLEDDDAISMGLKYSFEKEGYEVTDSDSVFDAKKQWKSGIYDICILDINLPARENPHFFIYWAELIHQLREKYVYRERISANWMKLSLPFSEEGRSDLFISSIT